MNNNRFLFLDKKARNTYNQQPKIFNLPNSKYYNMSIGAKYLYGILEDRYRLSIKNKWVDELGRIYFLYNQKSLCVALATKDTKTLRKYLKELEEMELLYRHSMGKGLPDRYYLLEPEITEEESYLLYMEYEYEVVENSVPDTKNQKAKPTKKVKKYASNGGEENFPKGGKENFPKGLGKISPRSNNYNNNNYNNNNIPIYSNNNIDIESEINNKENGTEQKTYCNLEEKEVVEEKINDIMVYTACSYSKYQCMQFLNVAKGDVELFKYTYDKVLESLNSEKDKTIKNMVSYIAGAVKKEAKKFYSKSDDNI